MVKPNRCILTFYEAKSKNVDECFLHLLNSLKPDAQKIYCIVNGELSKQSQEKLQQITTNILQILHNSNEPLYKLGLNFIGWEEAKNIDELLIVNDRFFGPVFSWEEILAEMESRNVDFWAVSDHGNVTENQFMQPLISLYYLHMDFMSISGKILKDKSFKQYVEKEQSIQEFEKGLTSYLHDKGYRSAAYISTKDDDFSNPNPMIYEVARTIEKRCPIIKKELFSAHPIKLDHMAANLPKALELIIQEDFYDMQMIWSYLNKNVEPRIFHYNTGLMNILPNFANPNNPSIENLKVAICTHIYYTEMLDDLYEYMQNMPVRYDIIVTTDTDEKRDEIHKFFDDKKGKDTNINKIIILIVEQNRGRDMSSLFITCRDIFLNSDYDAVCRIHSKKKPEVFGTRRDIFKDYLFYNLMGSSGYLSNLLALFAKDPYLGIAMPPTIPYSYTVLGASWFVNKEGVEYYMKELGLTNPLDEITPLAPIGGMYWFKPKALYKMFEYEWQWEDYNKEPYHEDGSLAHIQERLIAYVALGSDFNVAEVLNSKQAEIAYSNLEGKYTYIRHKVGFRDITRYLFASQKPKLGFFKKLKREINRIKSKQQDKKTQKK